MYHLTVVILEIETVRHQAVHRRAARPPRARGSDVRPGAISKSVGNDHQLFTMARDDFHGGPPPSPGCFLRAFHAVRYAGEKY